LNPTRPRITSSMETQIMQALHLARKDHVMIFGHHTTHWPSCPCVATRCGMRSRLAYNPDGRQKNIGINTNPVNTRIWHRGHTERRLLPPTDANALQLHLFPCEPPARLLALAPGLKTYKSLSIHQSAEPPSQDAFLPDIRSQLPLNPSVPGTQVSRLEHPRPVDLLLSSTSLSEKRYPHNDCDHGLLFGLTSPPLRNPSSGPRCIVARAKKLGCLDNRTPRKTRRNARFHGCRVPGNLHAREPQAPEICYPQKQTSHSLYDVVMYSDCAPLSQFRPVSDGQEERRETMACRCEWSIVGLQDPWRPPHKVRITAAAAKRKTWHAREPHHSPIFSLSTGLDSMGRHIRLGGSLSGPFPSTIPFRLTAGVAR